MASTSTVPATGPRRLWFPLGLVGAFWAFLFVADQLEMTMFLRFISRMIAYLVLLLGFLGWWFTNRGVSHRDRWLAIGVAILMGTVAGVFADRSMNGFTVFLVGMPYLLTSWTAWLFVSRKASFSLQRYGLVVLAAVIWGSVDLVRWEGLDGGQHSIMSWRWQPTAEELFLAEHAQAANASSPANAEPIVLQPGDWPEFRGPQRDSQVHGLQIATDWATRPPTEIWRHRVGPAWSSVILVAGRLFTQEQRDEQEAVVCYDAATGQEIWAHLDDERFSEGLSGPGPRGTPTFAEGRLYTLGGLGRLNCLDPVTGRRLWMRDTVADSGAPLPQWGVSNSPLVVDGIVVIYAGGEEDNGVLAYHADTGEPAWKIAAGKNSYSSPQLATIGGIPQLLFLSTTGLTSVEPRSGKILWQFSLVGDELFTPVVQPQRVDDSQLLIQTASGIALVEVSQQGDQWTATERWASTKLKPSLNDFVVHEGAIYGFDDGIFECLDLATGERRWKRGRYGHGQVLLLKDQGLLLITSEQGKLVLLAARPDKLEELGDLEAIQGKTWNHPVVAHGRLYVRNDEEMACLHLPVAENR